MPNAPKPTALKPQQLLVEGKNDQHVVWALCQEHQLPETFSVIAPKQDRDQDKGISNLLPEIQVKLKGEDLQTLGIMVDADQDLAARWQALRDRLVASGYNIPQTLPPQGLVCPAPDPYLKKLGVWIMPDNQLPGIIENFAAQLVPDEDELLPIAEDTLNKIEQAGLNRYSAVSKPKALIHTWLAWQEKPGKPIGQAITAKVLQSNSSLALVFVDWLKRLFI